MVVESYKSYEWESACPHKLSSGQMHYVKNQRCYKCVYNSVYYILHKMQFKESASPERNLILAFENAA